MSQLPVSHLIPLLYPAVEYINPGQCRLLSSLRRMLPTSAKLRKPRMDGVSSISNGSVEVWPVHVLSDSGDYLISSSCDPALRTVNEINAAREEMRHPEHIFAERDQREN